MHESGYILSGILVAAAVTWTLRAAPFLLLGRLEHSELLTYLGQRMPVGILIILTAYTMRDTSFSRLDSAAPMMCGLVVTVGLHLWKRNPTLSIFAGTAVAVLVGWLAR